MKTTFFNKNPHFICHLQNFCLYLPNQYAHMKLVHPFLFRCHDIDKLLGDTNKLSTFCTKLEKQSVLFPNRYEPESYKGDGFELFVEALLKLSPIDNRICIGNYEPVLEGDVGVDGIGIGLDGNLATVQIKYRANNTQLLTANEDHLSDFLSASILKYGVVNDSINNMLVITTAKGLHHFTKSEMLYDKVRCLGHEDLRSLVDDNMLFWDAFRNLIKESRL